MAKSNCHPSNCHPSNKTVTEIGAKVNLQCLIDHTMFRIVKILSNDQKSNIKIKDKLVSKCKWGMDGSGGQENCKMRATFDDNSVFVITFIPIELISDSIVIIWSNLTPNSIRFCRPPIEYIFSKETFEITKKKHFSLMKMK